MTNYLQKEIGPSICGFKIHYNIRASLLNNRETNEALMDAKCMTNLQVILKGDKDIMERALRLILGRARHFVIDEEAVFHRTKEQVGFNL